MTLFGYLLGKICVVGAFRKCLCSHTSSGAELVGSKMLPCKMPALFSSVWSGQKRGCWIAQSLLIEWLPGSVEAPGLLSVCRLAGTKAPLYLEEALHNNHTLLDETRLHCEPGKQSVPKVQRLTTESQHELSPQLLNSPC